MYAKRMNHSGESTMAVVSSNNTYQDELLRLWGSKVNKLTPQQAQLVVEILRDLEQRKQRCLQLA